MDTRDQQRARLVPAVAKALRAHDVRVALGQLVGSPSHQRIIAALPDDPMSYMFGQLAGVPSIVAMAREDRLDIAVFAPASAARIALAEEDDAKAQVHPDATISMLFEYLLHVDSAVVIEQLSARLLRSDVPVFS